MNQEAIVEGLLFISGEDGISFEDVSKVLSISEEEFNMILNHLKNIYEDSTRGITIEQFGRKIRMATKKEHLEYYEKYLNREAETSLSNATLEVLAIVAYNQPVTRSMVDDIRGVSSSHILRRLLSKNLIESKGKSDLPGRPHLYGVTDLFLNYFGLSSIDDLPRLNVDEGEIEEKDLYESKYSENIEVLDDV